MLLWWSSNSDIGWQLGDGRQINLGEVKHNKLKNWALQLKEPEDTLLPEQQNGLSPYCARSIREYLCSEANAHFRRTKPTRALSLALSGRSSLMR